jgi:predicted regulator of Ras-like GTPase activity (Roadblock/LC7/MglB family)
VPYQSLLDDLVRSVVGAEAALLLDETGEVAVESGPRRDRHRLIGAYQGIALLALERLSGRHGLGRVVCVQCRYARGTLLMRPVKDGYYLVLLLAAGATVAEAAHRSLGTRATLQEEI